MNILLKANADTQKKPNSYEKVHLYYMRKCKHLTGLMNVKSPNHFTSLNKNTHKKNTIEIIFYKGTYEDDKFIMFT